MPRLLPQHSILNYFLDLIIRCTAPHHGSQISFFQREKTSAKLAVGCDPNPVTVIAKWLTDGADESELAGAFCRSVTVSWLCTMLLDCNQRLPQFLLKTFDDFMSRHDFVG